MDGREDHAQSEVGDRWMEAMRRGDFESAWLQTDRIERARRNPASRPLKNDDHLVWDGSPLAGRILVRCEHGLGDSIQFARYFPLLGSLARQLIVKVQPQLLGLFAGLGGIDRLLNAWSPGPEPAHDVALECMELAYAFRSSVETIPNSVPYLSLAHLQDELPFEISTRRNVGLLWASSAWDHTRSLALHQLAALAQFPEIHFFSLQQGDEAADFVHAPFPLRTLSAWTRPVENAAAAMLKMDLIIAVDGMPAHLAGALGRPIWLLLPAHADWRWMSGSLSPWYPTMRIFRQPRPGDWASPIRELTEALSSFFAAC